MNVALNLKSVDINMKQLDIVPQSKIHQWLQREAKSADLSFIYATWLNSYWVDGRRPGVTKTDFYKVQRNLLDRLLLNSETIVAYLPQNENVIIGYICFDESYLHYIYIKEDFRGFGVATDLYEKALEPRLCTYLTGQAKLILNNKKEKLIYNPLFITNLLLHYLKQQEEI